LGFGFFLQKLQFNTFNLKNFMPNFERFATIFTYES